MSLIKLGRKACYQRKYGAEAAAVILRLIAKIAADSRWSSVKKLRF